MRKLFAIVLLTALLATDSGRLCQILCLSNTGSMECKVAKEVAQHNIILASFCQIQHTASPKQIGYDQNDNRHANHASIKCGCGEKQPALGYEIAVSTFPLCLRSFYNVATQLRIQDRFFSDVEPMPLELPPKALV